MSQAPTPDPAPVNLDELRRIAAAAARVGGDVARASFGSRLTVRLKVDRSEVTEVDFAAQRAIIDLIRGARPDDAFLGEESTEHGDEAAAPDADRRTAGESTITWVIDPIDGTRNYVRRIPLYVCSVAAMQDGLPVAGAIYDPVRAVMYTAARGAGAQANDEALCVSRQSIDDITLKPRKLIVAIPSIRRPRVRRLVQAAIDRHVIRNLGATALHLAHVAEGAFDASISNNSRLWDIAAGVLLVEEAGGRIASPFGEPLFPIDPIGCRGDEIPTLAAAPHAYEELLVAR